MVASGVFATDCHLYGIGFRTSTVLEAGSRAQSIWEANNVSQKRGCFAWVAHAAAIALANQRPRARGDALTLTRSSFYIAVHTSLWGGPAFPRPVVCFTSPRSCLSRFFSPRGAPQELVHSFDF